MKVPNWDKFNPDPCKECDERQQDDCYGRVCDWWCNKGVAYANREIGAKAILDCLIACGLISEEQFKEWYTNDSKIG